MHELTDTFQTIAVRRPRLTNPALDCWWPAEGWTSDDLAQVQRMREAGRVVTAQRRVGAAAPFELLAKVAPGSGDLMLAAPAPATAKTPCAASPSARALRDRRDEALKRRWDIVKREWPLGMPEAEILDLVNAVPGWPWLMGDVAGLAKALHLERPA